MRSELEQQRLELQKNHSTEMETMLEKVGATHMEIRFVKAYKDVTSVYIL